MVRGPIRGEVIAGWAFREGDGELDEGEPGLLGELCQLLDGVELALVVGVG